MKHWVRIEFEHNGGFDNGYTQEVKTNHYYRENEDNTLLHVNWPLCINTMLSTPNWCSGMVLKEVTQKEFEITLQESIDYMGINITKHKFIKDAKK